MGFIRDALQRRQIGTMPLSYKILLPILLLVMLTEIIIGFYSYTTSVQSAKDLARANLSAVMSQVKGNLLYQIRDTQRISDALFNNLGFQRSLIIRDDDYLVYGATAGEIVPWLESSMQISVNNVRVMLYPANDQIYETRGTITGEVRDKSQHILDLRRISGEPWFAELERSELTYNWMQVETDREDGNISLFRKLISFDDFETVIGYLRITISLRELFLSLTAMTDSVGAIVYVNDDRTGAPVYSTAREAAGQVDESNGYLAIREQLLPAGWVMEAFVPDGELRKGAVRIRNLTLLVCLLSFVVMGVIGYFIAQFFGRKVHKIVSLVHNFQEGDFGKRIRVSGKDEFAQIADAFNTMASNIDELIREVYIRGIQKKEAELEVLQAQINPHFLYNTLSSINTLANRGAKDRLSAMINGLVKFYRLTLNNGQIVISVGDEVEQVKAYLDIQAIKYTNRFTVSYEIEPGIVQCPTIKLILQPFVENVLKHAWYDERIHIRLLGYRDGELIVLKVIDNGIGMSRDTLEQLTAQDGSSPGYGIRNVDQRIKLHFGPQYGVYIFSRPGIGTTVKLSFPYRMETEDGGN